MARSEVSRQFDAVMAALSVAKRHRLEVEVMTFALRAMKADPSLSVEDAVEAGLAEWVK